LPDIWIVLQAKIEPRILPLPVMLALPRVAIRVPKIEPLPETLILDPAPVRRINTF
jgi:hypothetical protein